jgi:hypothetical protein
LAHDHGERGEWSRPRREGRPRASARTDRRREHRGARRPQRCGGAGSLADLLVDNAFYSPRWIVFSVVLLAAIDRRRERLDSARTVTRLFDASTLFFFVPYVAQEAALSLLSEGKPLTHLATRLRNWPPFFIFVDFVLLSRCFESLYALGIVRAQIVRERHRRELESEMLGLRLELERQRLASIRAQLEPHFLFNALNATSGLVRTEERAATIIPGSLRPSESLRSAARAGHHARS